MEVLKIEILNPKAKKLLMNLMDLKLIRVSEAASEKEKFSELLAKMRQDNVPTLDEIQSEVKAARKNMGG